MDYKIGDLIAKHQEVKAIVAEISARHKEEMTPYTSAMNTIETAIGAELTAQGLQNFKSDAGTAYLSTTMSVKVADRGAYLGYLISERAWDMLDARALKEPVKEFLDKNDGTPPPGLTVEFNTACNIRKS